MFKVQYKVSNAKQSWQPHGTYGSETEALSSAGRIADKYFMVRVLNPDGAVIFSA